ncbi:pyridoxamine 5'-phosphate oxidase [Georgenia soli]|uniref:Pyridoxamine 5'-phosphate oxidase n=1 Tax=Georgenia soli TaxID=638953 RepID=A0A2A9ERN6_9MICO|nr:pyridoxamine 5'-phosphate oxidase family protein [Georgenia soli]PFG40922.1 pyridoxamine 5'-phosphate oxidase [Georgenia soli]
MTAADGLRARLRGLTTFPEDLPPFDVERAPAAPAELFLGWLEDAVATGVPAPHAVVVATVGPDGRVTARNVLLTDVDAAGWHFSTPRSSPKALDLAARPRAAMTFFWPVLGRQVRLSGSVSDLGPEAAEHFRARSEASRAGTLVGHQSEHLDSLERYAAAFADALEQVRADPDLVDERWTDHALAPDTVEFFQAARPGNVRLRYRTDGAPGRWTTELLWP